MRKPGRCAVCGEVTEYSIYTGDAATYVCSVVDQEQKGIDPYDMCKRTIADMRENLGYSTYVMTMKEYGFRLPARLRK